MKSYLIELPKEWINEPYKEETEIILFNSIKGKCIHCGKKVSDYSIKCKSCSNKLRKGYHFKDLINMKRGEIHYNFKGDDVGYSPLHRYISKRKQKPISCEICKQEKILELANISGEYQRDINDYEWICRKCHMQKDGRNRKLNLMPKHERFKL